MSLGFTQDELTALKKALASGVTEVQLGDRRIKYASLNDMMKVIQMIQSELEGDSTDLESNPNVIQSGFTRGE